MTKDIDSFWGSHTPSLHAALMEVPPGSLVIEHGAGLYSSTVISRYDVHVLLIEEAPGWTSWAKWLYEMAGRDCETLDRAKPAISRLATAGLVFIDGANRERGDLLKWSLQAGAPLIVAHDTEDDVRKLYGCHSHLFDYPGYTVTHDVGGERSRHPHPHTTTWRKTA